MSSPRAWKADLALAAITFIWGATFVLVKQALADASTLLFLALRFSLAALALALAFRPLPGKFVSRNGLWSGGALCGTFLFAGYLFQTVGLRYTTASKSAFITGLAIVMVPVFDAAVGRRLPQSSEAAGVLVAAIGMALMTLRGESLAVAKGDVLTFGCAVAFAVHILLVGHYAPRLGFQALTLLQIGTAALLSLGTCWWVEVPVIRWRPGVLMALVVTGLFATALAFAVQAWAQQYTSPTHTALIFALEPVFAWVTSFILAGEVLPLTASLGAFLILAGILLVELKPWQPKSYNK